MTSWDTILVWLPIPGWIDVVDIAIVAAFGWFAIRYFRRTRARPALAGLALLGVVYLIAREVEMRLSTALLQGFFAVVVIVLVVVFQEDLRRLFEQLGSLRRQRQTPVASQGAAILDGLVRTVARLASNRCGALIVIPGREPLARHVEGGIAMHGRMTEPLLLSIFDSSSPGHDGAVVLDGPNIESFAVHLPLSSNRAALGQAGTRHAAALGLAERCDAICIVVSEERGTISITRDGEIQTLQRAEDLLPILRPVFLRDEIEAPPWWRGGAGLDALVATAGAVILWVLVVAGSDVAESTVSAPIEVTNLPAEMRLTATEPARVAVVLRGLRRDLVLAERAEVVVEIDAYLARLGRRTFSVDVQQVRRPESLDIVSIDPERVRLSIETLESDEASEQP